MRPRVTPGAGGQTIYDRRYFDDGSPVVGGGRVRHLPWDQPRHGLAAGGVGGADGKPGRGLVPRASGAGGGASFGHGGGPFALFSHGHACRIAARVAHRRGLFGDWPRDLPADQPPPSTVSVAGAAFTFGALVFPCRHGAWGGAD